MLLKKRIDFSTLVKNENELQKAFTIYNASAGAGKTYTLVRSYLTTLLKSQFTDSYKSILALTFTNKAVAEMKTRVLQNLVAISSQKTPAPLQPLLTDLVNATNIPEPKLKKKAAKILNSILHNYASFDIVTIDTFMHRILRTFAYDLRIPMNFEIEMDQQSLINEAVDRVIDKVGVDKELSSIIIDFALNNLDEDKSWDITTELQKIASRLFLENDRRHLKRLSSKSYEDFNILKQILEEKITSYKNLIITEATEIIQLWNSKDIQETDFTRNLIPKHFKKLIMGETKIDFQKAKWMQDITTTSFYNKTLHPDKKSNIDQIRSQIENSFLSTKKIVLEISLLKNIAKNVTPLSILNAIQKEISEIKKEKRILLIAEFNAIISNTIQDQPAPFIYERLGERYRNYFIDEFQDTSKMQWENLIPLIDNAISTETLNQKIGHLTIVGDAKQAIYRWRGGKAEQFITLSQKEVNPFSYQEQEVIDLPKNYRSYSQIVEFNNDFFTYLSNSFSKPSHQQLYKKGNHQETNKKEGGYVNISFIEAKTVSEENEIYPNKVRQTILELERKGYSLNEICILVRKQKEGICIANYLTDNNIPILSSETLLISNSPEVNFIINLSTWFMQRDHLSAKIDMLHFLTDWFSIPNKHIFLKKMIKANDSEISKTLKQYEVDFNFSILNLFPLYDAIEYIISSFGLSRSQPAYLQFFLDVVFSFSQKHTEGFIGFLTYWKHKKEKLSIVAPEGENAVRIMTIHKAKGLEFPCVIYPYATIDLYKELEPKTWFHIPPNLYHNFEEVLINYHKSLSEHNDYSKEMVLERNAQLELDNINLIYVALTRAVEQLYILSKLDSNVSGEVKNDKLSGKLINYLKHINLWNNETLSYSFGRDNRISTIKNKDNNDYQLLKLSSFDTTNKKRKITIATKASKLWNTKQGDAIEKGKLIHELLSFITHENDIEPLFQNWRRNGILSQQIDNSVEEIIIEIIRHPKLQNHFSGQNIVHNEKEIISKGKIYRPDSISINSENKVSIIDYKTGSYDIHHEQQIITYSEIIAALGYQVVQKILIYIGENISLKFI